MFSPSIHHFFYSKLLRPLLFSLDAESAHDLTLFFLKKTQNTILSALYRQAKIQDPVELLGLKFPNKVGLAAGLDKNAACIDAFCSMGFGFIEVGTVTPLAQAGNPKPRMFRIPEKAALINRLGFNNLGTQTFIDNVKRAQFQKLRTKPSESTPMLLGLNIGKNAVTPIEDAASDYLICLRDVYPFADYVTINISSPNTKNLRSLQNDEALEQLLITLEHERAQLEKSTNKHVPLFLKIAPDLDDAQIEVIANTLIKISKSAGEAATFGAPTGESSPAPSRSQSWGLIATNTTLSRDAVTGLNHSTESGGLSGGPVFESSNRVIKAMRERLGPDFAIIGVGGICSAQDALEKIKAGANLVQIYTGLIYRGPCLVNEIAQAIKASK
jgi:dihydroorotate dehydrogenase